MNHSKGRVRSRPIRLVSFESVWRFLAALGPLAASSSRDGPLRNLIRCFAICRPGIISRRSMCWRVCPIGRRSWYYYSAQVHMHLGNQVMHCSMRKRRFGWIRAIWNTGSFMPDCKMRREAYGQQSAQYDRPFGRLSQLCLCLCFVTGVWSLFLFFRAKEVMLCQNLQIS